MTKIDIPPKGKSTGRKPKYKLADMKIGERRFFTGDNVRSSVSKYGKKANKFFVCRKQTDNSIMVIRTK